MSPRLFPGLVWPWDINGLSLPEASVVATAGMNSKCIDVADGSIGYIGYIVHAGHILPLQ